MDRKHTWEQLAKCAEREVRLRKNVFGMGQGGALTPTQESEISMMVEIAGLLREKADAELSELAKML